MDPLFHYLFSLKQIESTLKIQDTAKSNFDVFQSFHVFFMQYNYLTLLMFSMPRIHSQRENERKEIINS